MVCGREQESWESSSRRKTEINGPPSRRILAYSAP